MWDALEAWAPVVRDVLSVGLAALGAYLAWLAVRMGREQDEVTKKQTALLEGLQALEAKQAEIAEKQHEMSLSLVRRRPEMTMWVTLAGGTIPGKADWNIFVENLGDRTARDFNWIIGVPSTILFDFNIPTGAEKYITYLVPSEAARLGIGTDDAENNEEKDWTVCRTIRGFVAAPIHPKSRLNLGVVTTTSEQRITFYWRIETEDGMFPFHGYLIPMSGDDNLDEDLDDLEDDLETP